MKKAFFLFVLLISLFQVSAQRRSQIQLTSSLRVKGVGNTSGARFIRPVFAHEGSTLAADSADYNQAANAFDAYGHVVITQPDGTVIYSDVLNYDGNTRVAILTNNVRMVDKDAILTTNYLKYNMGTKIGTYIGGGKIENGQNVLTSKNGYYFANSRDAYFRYDVVVNTPDALIKTDTLKYNTESKVSWFYGPTNIYGKGQNKESKLYTENGRYNTLTDQAWFGKKNHYTEGSKSLKGDSLYYDGKAGFGKAINNITFLDTVQKVILKGNQGIYRKRDESALVTRNAYVVIETEQDSATVDSIWMTADTLITKLIPLKQFVKATNEELKSDQEIATDPVIEGEGIVVQSEPAPAERKPENATATPPAESRKERRRRKQQEDKKQEDKKQEDKKPAGDDKAAAVVTAADSSKVAIPPEQKKGAVDGVGTTDSSKVAVSQTRKKGGIAGASPSDSSKVATPQAQKKGSVVGAPATDNSKVAISQAQKKGVVTGTPAVDSSKVATRPALASRGARPDSSKKSDSSRVSPGSTAKRGSALHGQADSVKKGAVHRESAGKKAIDPADTAKTRVIYAFHKVKIFKSDLQSRSDSAFYSYADSIIRSYKNPIIWTQGSQLTADTIYMQMKNRKLDNMLLQHNGFVVSTEGDSSKFNQVKGKVITGVFKDNKLESMYIDGNAESVYYTMEDSVYSGMNRSLSSRMRLTFGDNKLKQVMFVRKPEGKFYPIERMPKDIEILDGFIWKPKDRPKSKEEIIPDLRKRRSPSKAPAGQKKPASKATPAGKQAVQPAKGNVSGGAKAATAVSGAKGNTSPVVGKPGTTADTLKKALAPAAAKGGATPVPAPTKGGTTPARPAVKDTVRR